MIVATGIGVLGASSAVLCPLCKGMDT